MEILLTIAYFFLVRLVFFEYKWLKFSLFWKFLVFGLYAIAALTEVILLGQFAPYAKDSFVQAYVIQLAPEFGGIVTDVHAKANEPLKKGDPVFSMDPTPWKNRLREHQALLALAQETYDRLHKARPSGAVSQLAVDQALDQMHNQQAEVDQAQYNVDHATISAPSDGYAVNLQLRPGAFIRLKAPVVDFVSTEEYWIVAVANQKASQWIQPGNEAEIALDMYPGRVFPAKVEAVVFATAQAQAPVTGTLPKFSEFLPSDYFAVKLRRDGEFPDHPLRFGAKGLTAIYTGRGPDVFRLLRELEIRSESFLNYIYNPFSAPRAR